VNYCKRLIFTFIAFSIPLLTTSRTWAEYSPETIMDALNENWDSPSSINKAKIDFIVSLASNPLGFKMSAENGDGILVVNGNSFYMAINYQYEEPPVYEPKTDSNAVDYDDYGNRVVWRSKSRCLWYSEARNDALIVSEGLHVDADNEIVDAHEHHTLYRFPNGEAFRQSEFRDLWMVLGRGIGNVVRVDRISEASSGLINVIAAISVGEATAFEWNITLDPEANLLVRNASLAHPGMDPPMLEMYNSGIIKVCDLSFPTFGEIIHRLSEAQYMQQSYMIHNVSEIEAEDGFIEEVKDRFRSPLPLGSTEIDYREGNFPIHREVSGIIDKN